MKASNFLWWSRSARINYTNISPRFSFHHHLFPFLLKIATRANFRHFQTQANSKIKPRKVTDSFRISPRNTPSVYPCPAHSSSNKVTEGLCPRFNYQVSLTMRLATMSASSTKRNQWALRPMGYRKKKHARTHACTHTCIHMK